ncbi:Pentatricopeptide repeat-containing protein [Glycine max]|nr:Pentatricopeptide repeat-containing protein [Glycine max]
MKPNLSLFHSLFHDASCALLIFRQLLQSNANPNHLTFSLLIKAFLSSSSFSRGSPTTRIQVNQIPTQLLKRGIDQFLYVNTALIDFYMKLGFTTHARQLFEDLPSTDVVSWNVLICGYTQNGHPHDALQLFVHMLRESFRPNQITIASLLPSCGHRELFLQSRSVHAFGIKAGLGLDPQLSNSLNSIYSEKGEVESVVQGFIQTVQLDIKPDAVALIRVLHGISDPSHFAIGCAFHGYGLKSGLNNDCLVANGLISTYSRFDEIQAALSLFFDRREKPLITWNSVISGCVQAGNSSDAMELFFQMNMCGQKPDAITITSLLSGCCQLGYLQIGETLHGYILRNNLKVEDFTVTALIDMYTKCGRLDYAEKVFYSINDPRASPGAAVKLCLGDLLVMGSNPETASLHMQGLYGLEHKAFSCFSKLQEQGLEPDKITFLGVLAACTHGGLVYAGMEYFRIMREEYGLMPTLQHYACLVGLLGRAGLFKEAIDIINNMEIRPDSAVWVALLSACWIQQEVKLGQKFVFIELQKRWILCINVKSLCDCWEVG